LKLSDIAINAAAIETGRWVSVGHILPGVKFKVRGLDNADYRRLRAKLIAEIPRAERVKGVDPVELDKINVKLLYETVLLDWSGIEGDDDASLSFSKEQAAELLADPNYAVLRGAVEWAAGVVGEDDLAETEASAKN
jgi:hypothetical protein